MSRYDASLLLAPLPASRGDVRQDQDQDQPYSPADWWYVEGQPRTGALATLSAVDGAFFTSLFFFVSAVFVPGSYDRRGARRFLTGRLLRLGLPLLVGALTIVPGLMYA